MEALLLLLLLLVQLSRPLKPCSQASQHSFRFYGARASCSGTVLFPALSLKFAFKSGVAMHGSASAVLGTKNLTNDTVYLLCS